jgi:HSP20 family molecular chaperone IbpA
MVRRLTLSCAFLLGFDEIEPNFKITTGPSSDGYPPYNIERIIENGIKVERLRITLAVAGFTANQLEIKVEQRRLLIHGRQRDEKERIYFHRGIAARKFQRVFLFAEALQVATAALEDGLLSVELIRPNPEPTLQKLNIMASN